MLTLGLNGRPFAYHDAAVALLDDDGHVLFHAEEERFSRVKHGVRQAPVLALAAALRHIGGGIGDVGSVAVGWDPSLYRTSGHRTSSELRQSVAEMMGLLRLPDGVQRVEFVRHHAAHAAHAFFGSGFDRAAVVVIDGSGECDSSSIHRADGDGIEQVHREPIHRSLGYLYQACSTWLGFGEFGGGKTMGLASYGSPGDTWDLDQAARSVPATMDHTAVMAYWGAVFADLTGRLAAGRETDALVEDETSVRLARSVQDHVAFEVTRYVERARELVGEENVCLAGGVALNSVANGLVPDPVFVPNCPGDGGVALGAAYSVTPPRPAVANPFSGTAVGREDWLRAGADLEEVHLGDAARRLIGGEIGALFVGRSECGPRALGHRSLLCRSDRLDLARQLNSRKGREWWRPLGPVALPGKGLWTERDHLDRYMAGVVEVVGADGAVQLEGVCHIDGTVRPQRVDDRSELLAELLTEVEQQSDLRSLINTSFNLAGEPIVETAEQALRTAAEIDVGFLLTDHGYVLRPRATFLDR